MSNDMKFGLVVGVGLVIAVAVLFFPHQPTEDTTAPVTDFRAEPKPQQQMTPAMLPPPSSLPKPGRR